VAGQANTLRGLRETVVLPITQMNVAYSLNRRRRRCRSGSRGYVSAPAGAQVVNPRKRNLVTLGSSIRAVIR
jgi:hypothetical protein